MMPSQGMILGGTISLKGRNLTLASFHGINFRSRYWALFNIQQPYILFSTEAQKMEDEGEMQSLFRTDDMPRVRLVGQALADVGNMRQDVGLSLWNNGTRQKLQQQALN